MKDKLAVCFFPGAETRDDRFNIFTGSYIRLMSQILENDFRYIKGINYKLSVMNVIWALNNAQKPKVNPEKDKITHGAFRQITKGLSPDTSLILTSSSSGSIIAAQTACYLAKENKHKHFISRPFHLVLGASMISTESDLFRQLISYRDEGIIGSIIHDELEDEGDTSSGIGGLSRAEAYRNAFGLLFPLFSTKFEGPSFLNANPTNGHIHRRRSNTVAKAIDFIDVILVKNMLAGDHIRNKALIVCKREYAL